MKDHRHKGYPYTLRILYLLLQGYTKHIFACFSRKWNIQREFPSGAGEYVSLRWWASARPLSLHIKLSDFTCHSYYNYRVDLSICVKLNDICGSCHAHVICLTGLYVGKYFPISSSGSIRISICFEIVYQLIFWGDGFWFIIKQLNQWELWTKYHLYTNQVI